MALYSHQSREVDEHTFAPARALLWEPRVGKTRTIVTELRMLKLPRVLVAGPIMALRMTWADELRALDVAVFDLTIGSLEKRIATLRALPKDNPRSVIVLVNLDVLKRMEAALLRWKPSGVIVDEGHLIKSPSAERTKTLIKLGKRAAWRRLLTGTPTPRSYADVFAQYKFLDPTIFGGNQAEYRSQFCYTHPVWKSKITGYLDLPEFERRMFSIATRVTRAECFDMPSVQEIERKIVLPATARKAYDSMVKNLVLDMAGLPKVDATHKLARLVKLQKLTAGFVSENDELAWVQHEKINAVIEELAEPLEAGAKVIVSYYFEHEGAELERHIREHYGITDKRPGGVNVERLSGSTPQRHRERITSPYALGATRDDNRGGVLIVQESIGGLGISLAAADYMIFTSCSMDGAAHSQMRDRIWAPSKRMTYTYLRVPNSVDTFIKKVLTTKSTAQTMLLDVGFTEAAYGDALAAAA